MYINLTTDLKMRGGGWSLEVGGCARNSIKTSNIHVNKSTRKKRNGAEKNNSQQFSKLGKTKNCRFKENKFLNKLNTKRAIR